MYLPSEMYLGYANQKRIEEYDCFPILTIHIVTAFHLRFGSIFHYDSKLFQQRLLGEEGASRLNK